MTDIEVRPLDCERVKTCDGLPRTVLSFTVRYGDVVDKIGINAPDDITADELREALYDILPYIGG